MALPHILIRRSEGLTPEGTTVEIDGHVLPGVHDFDWHVEAGDVDTITLRFHACVTVLHAGSDAKTDRSTP